MNFSPDYICNILWNLIHSYICFSIFGFQNVIRPELKPVEKEVEVVLKFPIVEPLSPPILQLSEVGFAYNAARIIFSSVNLNATLESRICIVSILTSDQRHQI